MAVKKTIFFLTLFVFDVDTEVWLLGCDINIIGDLIGDGLIIEWPVESIGESGLSSITNLPIGELKIFGLDLLFLIIIGLLFGLE